MQEEQLNSFSVNNEYFEGRETSLPNAAAEMELGRYLLPTRFICCNDPRIVNLSQRITLNCIPNDIKGKIKAIHDYVRDEIPFGFATSFYNQTAVEVISSGVGFCNTKGTLFQALLRASGVPARPVITDINADILRGVLNPGTPYVDHMFTEVYVDGKWLRTDSYIVDKKLFSKAVMLLKQEGKPMGYGVHIDGEIEWDVDEDCFSQLVKDSERTPDLTRGFEYKYEDIKAFYKKEPNAINRLGFMVKSVAFPVLTVFANKNVQSIRNQDVQNNILNTKQAFI